MYDTLYSFTSILLGSLVTDNHHMTDKERINFMASGKILNLFAAFFVAKIGLEIFETNSMNQFRIFFGNIGIICCHTFPGFTNHDSLSNNSTLENDENTLFEHS